ncbi:hypothetical protein FKW77_004028 [Venturia effusa]|uniref:Uncharacterized protein n=1 Tax=Venturia effusa TaxID=50376 RepID=A0A517LNR3_9PEZI|nr:hypothetical protein FKW77_004028 [Venturia effusa]
MAAQKREADTLDNDMQSLTSEEHTPSNKDPKARKSLKLVFVNSRAAREMLEPARPPRSSPTSPSEIASKKRKANTLVNDMKIIAKNVMKKYKSSPGNAAAINKTRKPLKIVLGNRRKTAHKDDNEAIEAHIDEDKMTSTRPRTSFFNLPRELRQKILILARPWRTAWVDEKKWMAKIISVLKEVHPDLLDDVGYVEKRWMRSLTEELDEAGFTWESLAEQELRLFEKMGYNYEHWCCGFVIFTKVRIGRACEGDSGKTISKPVHRRPSASFSTLPQE